MSDNDVTDKLPAHEDLSVWHRLPSVSSLAPGSVILILLGSEHQPRDWLDFHPHRIQFDTDSYSYSSQKHSARHRQAVFCSKMLDFIKGTTLIIKGIFSAIATFSSLRTINFETNQT